MSGSVTPAGDRATTPRGAAGLGVDPRVRILYLAWVFLLVSILAHPLWLTLVWLVTLAVALASRLPVRGLVKAGRLGWYIAGVSWLLWMLALRRQGLPLVAIGPWQVTAPGVFNGLSVAARIAAILLAFLVVFQSTPTRHVMTALHRLRVSVPFAMVIGITLRLIPQLRAEHATILEAQRSRAVEFDGGSVVARLHKHTAYVIPLVLRALKITADLSLAMEARAFDPYARRTFSIPLVFRRSDVAWLVLMALALIAAIAARATGPGGMPAQWVAGG